MVDFKKTGKREKQSAQSPVISNAGSKVKREKLTARGLSRQERWTRFLIIGGIMILTAWLFSNAIHNNFLDWDDNAYLRDNADIRSLDAAHLKAMFSNYYVANWQPLTVLSYALEYSLAGLSSPVLYHVDNIILHLVNVLLVFILSILVFRNKWVGGLAALLFAIHPLRVESVSWIAERKDVLYACFFLLAMIAWHYYLVRGRVIPGEGGRSGKPAGQSAWLFYFLTVLAFLLSGMAKSAAIVLPFVLLLMDFLYKRKFTTGMLLDKLPLLLISLFLGVMALKSQAVAIKTDQNFGLFYRLLIINHSFLRYLWLTVFPVKLSALHPWPLTAGGKLPVLYFVSPLFSLGLAAVVYYSLKYTRKVAFAAGFFLVNLLLVLQFIQVGDGVISERYTYMPHVGLFMILAWYMVRLWEKAASLHRIARPVIAGVLGIIMIFFAWTTYARNPVWEGPISLWNDVIEKYPEGVFSAYYNRGKALHDLQQLDAAMKDYTRAIQYRPDHYRALTNRGLIRASRGDTTGAMSDYDAALKYNPSDHITYINRGSLKMNQKDYAAAEEDFSKAVDLNKGQIEGWYNRALARYYQQKFPGVIEDLDIVLSIRDHYVASYNYRGSSKFRTGDKAGACQDWQTGMQDGDQTCIENYNRFCK